MKKMENQRVNSGAKQRGNGDGELAPDSFLRDIQGEVAEENAPLLRFIIRHAGVIAGCVLALLLVIGGMAAWKWLHGGRQAEARAELARINMSLKGKDRDAALNKLAEKAPDSVKLFLYMNLGQNAMENGDPVLAADAYAKAAKLDGDGALGVAAALGNAGSLLAQAKYEQALALLQELIRKLPEADKSIQLQQLLAEAANNAGDLDLAQKTYAELAREVKTPDAAYFQNRADDLAMGLKPASKLKTKNK